MIQRGIMYIIPKLRNKGERSLKGRKRIFGMFIVLILVLSMCGTGFTYLDIAGNDAVSYAVDEQTDANNDNNPADTDASGDQAGDSSKADTATPAKDAVPASKEEAKESKDAAPVVTKPENKDSDTKIPEVTDRTIKADAKEAELYVKGSDGKKKRSDDLKAALRFWYALMEREALLPDDDSGTDRPVEVTVEGKLPEDVSAKIKYIEFEEGGVYSEPAIASFELVLLDGEGNDYIPDDPVTVIVSGDRVADALDDDSHVVVYSYAENIRRAKQYKEKYGKSFYAADAVAYRDGDADDSRRVYEVYDSNKKYVDGEDAVRFAEDDSGLSVSSNDNAVEFEYAFDKNSPARFAVSEQISERTLEDKAGTTIVKVNGALDKDAGLDTKDAGSSASDTVKGDSVVAVDVSLKDDEEGKYQPDQPVQVTIIDPSIRKAAAEAKKEESGLKLLSVDKDGKTTLVKDAEFDGSKVTFETDELSTYVITYNTVEECVKTADGRTWKVTATYGSDTGIPDKGVKLYVKKKFSLKSDVVTLDIKLVDEKNESKIYQPAEGTSVELKVTLLDSKASKSGAGDTAEVLHVREDGTKETLNADLEATKEGYVYTLNTESFSSFKFQLDGYAGYYNINIDTYYKRANGSDQPGSGKSSQILVKATSERKWEDFDSLATRFNIYDPTEGENYRYAVDYARDQGGNRQNLFAVGFFNDRLSVPKSLAIQTNGNVIGSARDVDLDLYLIDNSIKLEFKDIDGTSLGPTDKLYIHNFTGEEDIVDIVDKYRSELTLNGKAYVYSKVGNDEVDILTNNIADTPVGGKEWYKEEGTYTSIIPTYVVSYDSFGPYTYRPGYEWKYKTYTSTSYTGVGDTALTLTFATDVARVSTDGGNTWTYHPYLINGNKKTDPGHTDEYLGAFDQAKNSGATDVIIETLYKYSDRYVLPDGFVFDNDQNITLRTVTDAPYAKGFTSIIKRGENNTDSLVTVSNGSLTLDNITFDGNNGKGYTRQGNGGLINASSCTLTIQNGAAFKNSDTYGNGGAIYAADSVVLHLNENSSGKIKFENCNTKQRFDAGGAIYTTAKNLKLYNAEFEGCTSIDPGSPAGAVQCQGGAIYHWSNHTDAYFEAYHCTFNNCTAEAGGAVETQAYHITIKNSIFENCTAIARNGGGMNIYHDGVHGDVNGALISDCTFTGCKALSDKSNGGAIRSQDNNIIIEGGSISGCEAASGGAVYAEGNITLRKGVQITGNKLTVGEVTKAAGIYIVNGKQLILGGSTQTPEKINVKNNTTTSGIYSNVRVSETTVDGKTQNSPTSIKVLSELDSTCRIGVANAGVALGGTQFGISAGNWNPFKIDNAARVFVSDDASAYGKMDSEESKDGDGYYKLFWIVNAAFMITDVSDNVLKYEDQGAKVPALFDTLEDAYNCFTNNDFWRDDGQTQTLTEPAKIKMLIQSYTLKQNLEISLPRQNRKNLILTTASRDEGYQGQDEEGIGTILRGFNGTSMFYVNNGANVTITKLKIDGNRGSYRADTGFKNNVNGGGLFSIKDKGTKLTLAASAKLCNSNCYINTTRGGAVCVNPGAELEMIDDAEISNCTARSAGAVYLCTIETTKNVTTGVKDYEMCPRFSMKDTSKILNCTATEQDKDRGGDGGAVSLGAENYPGSIFELSGNAEISGCQASSGGSAIFIEGGKNSSGNYYNFGNFVIIKDSPTIKNNVTVRNISNNSKGGAIYIGTSATRSDFPLRIEGSPVFSNNYCTDNSYTSRKNGGRTVYKDGKVRQDIYLTGNVAGDYNTYRQRGNLSYIGITGPLSVGRNTIWVWAQNSNHYKENYQFAKFIKINSENSNPNTNFEVGMAATFDKDSKIKRAMSSFRNARSDNDTYGNNAATATTYLTGNTGVVNNLIYWSPAEGLRKVILRKMNSSHEPLTERTFDIRVSKNGAYVTVDNVELKDLESNSSGIFWIGTLPFGEYYIQETSPVQKGYILVVDQDGVTIEED